MSEVMHDIAKKIEAKKEIVIPLYDADSVHLADNALLQGHVLVSEATLGEQNTQELYRVYMENWIWWTPLVLPLLWSLPLVVLAGIAGYTGYLPVAGLLAFVGIAPLWVLKKLRRFYWIGYSLVWWNDQETATKQRLGKKLSYLSYGWYVERKKKKREEKEAKEKANSVPLEMMNIEDSLKALSGDFSETLPTFPVKKKKWYQFGRKQ